jgi:hypothetical protein
MKGEKKQGSMQESHIHQNVAAGDKILHDTHAFVYYMLSLEASWSR